MPFYTFYNRNRGISDDKRTVWWVFNLTHALLGLFSLPQQSRLGGVWTVASVALGWTAVKWLQEYEKICPYVSLENLVRHWLPVRHLKFVFSVQTCIWSTFLQHTQTGPNTSNKFILARSILDCKHKSVCVCVCWGGRVTVHWMRIQSERWTATLVRPYNGPLYTATLDQRSADARWCHGCSYIPSSFIQDQKSSTDTIS